MTNITQMSLDGDGGGDKSGLKPRRIHLREISGDSESPLETVGQDLRAARLRRGDEIAQVSRALKIRKDHLEALEEDRLEDLPGKTYAIGFVRSYARHLGLDSTQYVERFKRDISGRPEEQAHEPAPIHQEEGRRLPQGWRMVAGVVVVLLGYGVWHLMASGSGESSAPIPPAPVLNPPRPVAAAPKPVAPPQAAATPSPAASDTGVQAAQNPAPGQAASATPPPAAGARTPATVIGPNGASPLANGAAGQATLLPSGPAVPAASPGTGQVYGQQNANSRVVLRARGDTVLTVRSPDGQMLLNRSLKAGDSYQVPNQPGLTLATSNAGAVEVDMDGGTLGRVGQPQQVLGRVSLDPQSLADRFNAH